MSTRGIIWSAGIVTALGVAVGSADVVRKNVGGNDIPAMVVPAGPHYLTTPTGSSAVPISVPAGYFFEGSDAVEVLAPMTGVPMDAKPLRADGFYWVFGKPGTQSRASEPYDTVMVQYQDAVLPTIGSQATVDLKLDIVRMHSPDTIVVTGADQTREYTVSLDIRPFHQEDGRSEKPGWMHFTRTGIATGKFTAEFYAWARYRFTPLDGGTPVVYDLDDRLTIRVHEESPTRFYIPALYDPANPDEPDRAGGGGTSASVDGPCEDACCCCETEMSPGGWHCPYY